MNRSIAVLALVAVAAPWAVLAEAPKTLHVVETVQVKAMRPERDHLEIRFPRVEGYRVELPEERLSASFNDESTLELTPDLVGPSITRNQGIIGEGIDLTLEHLDQVRQSTLLFHLTKRLIETKWRDPGEEPKLHLFGQLKRITRELPANPRTTKVVSTRAVYYDADAEGNKQCITNHSAPTKKAGLNSPAFFRSS